MKKIWIEADMFGNKHVMIQDDSEEGEPFCYCSFNYDYLCTDNLLINSEAVKMARILVKRFGSTHPIGREIKAPTEDDVKELGCYMAPINEVDSDEDEYRIKPVLQALNVPNSDQVAKAISEHLDKTLSVYLDNAEEIRHSTYVEMSLYLNMALLMNDEKELRHRVQEIVKSIQKGPKPEVKP